MLSGLAVLRSLAEPADRLSMHRKTYEFTQTPFGLGRPGQLRAETRVLSVGPVTRSRSAGSRHAS